MMGRSKGQEVGQEPALERPAGGGEGQAPLAGQEAAAKEQVWPLQGPGFYIHVLPQTSADSRSATPHAAHGLGVLTRQWASGACSFLPLLATVKGSLPLGTSCSSNVHLMS